MKKMWPWFVLAAAVAAAAYFVITGRMQEPFDEGPHVDDSEMVSEADFDKAPPTGDELDLDSFDISFSNAVDQVSNTVENVKKAE